MQATGEYIPPSPLGPLGGGKKSAQGRKFKIKEKKKKKKRKKGKK